jgi:DNA uptake protein ComE-like DNA-binding protein
MKVRTGLRLAAGACVAVMGLAAVAQVGVGSEGAPGLIDPNVATAEELSGLPGMTEEMVAAVQAARPFTDALALDAFLTDAGFEEEARESFYARAFIHINLNTASEAEMMLIPGVGKRMAHEFDEYRPWTSFAQFDKEIGKYVDASEVARLRQYCFVPLDLNTATEEEFMTIPGVGERMAHEFDEYRPWKSKEQFEKEIGKYVDAREVARLWRYVVIE